jgi:signal-transduction protein with cAMP-binding, CBS, and nucleotidyltransferase domain
MSNAEEPIPIPRLSPASSVLEAAKLMISEQSSEVLIVDDSGRPTGVVRYADIVSSVAQGMPPGRTPVLEVMLKPPPMVDEEATVGEISKMFAKTEMRRILVRRGREIIGLIEAGELFNLVSASLEKTEIFKAVSVRARLRMAELLSVRPMSVEELAGELGIKPITVRHHIDVLRRNGIIEEVQEERFGKVGRPLSLFRTTHGVMRRATLAGARPR